MKVGEISVGSAPMSRIGIEQFGQCEWAKTDLGKLLIALWAERVWSGEYGIQANFGRDRAINFLEVIHPAFLKGGEVLIIHENNSTLTVDGVEEAVVAHIAAQLEALEEQRDVLKRKSVSLKNERSQIFRAKVKAEVAARFPEAATFQHFSQSDVYGYLCFISGNGMTEPIYVVRLNQGHPASIARLDMSGFEWHCLDSSHKRRLFWATIARAYVESGGLQKIPLGGDEQVFVENVGGEHIAEKVIFKTPGLKPTTICVSFMNGQPVDTVRADYPYTVE